MDRICLLITSFNRGHLLRNNLERLCKLTIPDEVLIVDDGSSDNTKQVCESFKDLLPIKYIYNHDPDWSICSMSRNIGIKNTDCDIVVTCEPECFGVTDFIAQMVKKHNEVPKHVISAGTLYHGGINSKTTQDFILNPRIKLNNPNITNNSSHNTNPRNSEGYAKIQGWVAPFSALYRKDWLFEINGWDEQFISWGFDDTDLLTRLTKIGVNQIIDREIELVHQYHNKLPPNIQFKASNENEKIFSGKNFDINNPNNDIKANKNKEWGIIRKR